MALTENGAVSYSTTQEPIVDLIFSSVRAKSREDVEPRIPTFDSCMESYPELTLKALFYIRDCRGGKGEKTLFHILMQRFIEKTKPENMDVLMGWIVQYGSWLDLFRIEGLPYTQFVCKQLKRDLEAMENGGNVSLCAKWIPSEGSKHDTGVYNRLTRAYYGRGRFVWRKGCFRKLVIVPLRNHIDILETKMSQSRWSDINYSKLPSKARISHMKCFAKRDGDRWAKYLSDVKKGKAKMGTDVLNAYEIVEKRDEILWRQFVKNMKERSGPIEQTCISMIDMSGSMTSPVPGTKIECRDVAISMALLLSELSDPSMRGHFIRFSYDSTPYEIDMDLPLSTITDIIGSENALNTNLKSAFENLIKKYQNNMPKYVFIFSDMQFDQIDDSNSDTNMGEIEKMFRTAEIERPTIVFWNVSSRGVDYPAINTTSNVILMSGYNFNSFTHVLNCLESGKFSPMSVVEMILDNYGDIVLSKLTSASI
jgi:hypothetical protein